MRRTTKRFSDRVAAVVKIRGIEAASLSLLDVSNVSGTGHCEAPGSHNDITEGIHSGRIPADGMPKAASEIAADSFLKSRSIYMEYNAETAGHSPDEFEVAQAAVEEFDAFQQQLAMLMGSENIVGPLPIP